MDSFVDSQSLRSSGRNVELPFRLQLYCNGQSSELVCTSVLRLLPGKRLVCLGEWNNRQVVAKLFLDPDGAKRHCDREEKGVRAFVDANINTPVLLFKGVIPPDNTPVLGFQRVVPSQSLAEVWTQSANDTERAELLLRAVVVIADQHNAGLRQNDPHLKNFLLSGDDIYSVDGDAVDTRKMGTPLPMSASLRNLGLFFAQFHPQSDRLTYKAFQAYAEKRAWTTEGNLFTRLLTNVRNSRDLRKKNYLKKTCRECTPFVYRKDFKRLMICSRDSFKEEMMGFLADPDDLLSSSEVLKQGNTSTVALVKISGQRIVVKRYNIKNIWHGFKRGFRHTRAWVSWRYSHLLVFLGIPTPKPIALLERRWGPFRSTAYFLTDFVDGIDAYHFLHSGKAKEIDQKSLVKQFGKIIQMLADASITHGDFKATNFIIAKDGLTIVDLDAMYEHRNTWSFHRAFRQDLKRFMDNWADLPEVNKMFRDELSGLQL